jgi:hypothetical protein
MPNLQSSLSLVQRRRSNVLHADRLRVVDDGSAHGARLVVARPFKRGDLVLPLIGRLTAPSYRSVQTGIHTHIEGSFLAFMNHSCRPSAIVLTQQLAVRAWRDLRVGEEVTFFYPSTEWEMVRPFKCLCGALDCIGYVAGARHLPLDLLGRYFLNPHIRELAANALARVAA